MAPRVQDLTGSIARNRNDKKGYEYAKDINNYYAELKGVDEEVKTQKRVEKAGRGSQKVKGM